MNVGISLKLDVTKIDKERLFVAKSGSKYLDLTCFLDTDKESKFGDHGMISHKQTEEEREAKEYTPICGNGTVFWVGNLNPLEKNKKENSEELDFEDEDLPF